MPHFLLAMNAAFQILFSSLLGAAMLVPMQPWGKAFARCLNPRAFLAAHLDWVMLAFMQLTAAYLAEHWPFAHARAVAWLLIFGGWINPIPYVMRGFGTNAFVFAGDAKQKLSATLSGVSSLAIITGWIVLVHGILSR